MILMQSFHVGVHGTVRLYTVQSYDSPSSIVGTFSSGMHTVH